VAKTDSKKRASDVIDASTVVAGWWRV